MSPNSFSALPSQASAKSASSASSLTALPIEIITEVFKSTDDFSTATALARTCRGLHSIWKSNAASICYALLVRTIPCYDQAFQFVQVQYAQVQRLDTVSSGLIDVTDRLVVKVTKQFLENADVAHEASTFYGNQIIKRFSKGPEVGPWPMQTFPRLECLTEAQRGRFLKAWYRLQTLAILPSDPLPYSILASLDRLEFEQMRDVLRWLVNSRFTAGQWYQLHKLLNSLIKGQPRNFDFWRFILHEACMDIEESGKGDSLADKLPPMGKEDTSHQFIESFHGFISRVVN